MNEATTKEGSVTIVVGGDCYRGKLFLAEDFADLSRWVQLEQDGTWECDGQGLIGRWRRNSPSLFLRESLSGDYLWQITVARVQPTASELEHFRTSKHWQNADALQKYNFNFWLRAADPSGNDFLRSYRAKLGSGWNGMGDDYWHSLFTTVVRNPEDNWVRLRQSPGYRMIADVHDAIPLLPYSQPHRCTFAVQQKRIRMYWDDHLVYDQQVTDAPQAGHLGLCVWLCNVRFQSMRLYRLK